MRENAGWVDVSDLGLVESFQYLTEREQRAVVLAVNGVRYWAITGEEPKPMIVRSSPENPFDLKKVAGILHELGINIGETLQQVDTSTVTFQPTPYNRSLLAGKLRNGEAKRLIAFLFTLAELSK